MILSPTPVLQFTDNDGNLLVGGQLFLYEAGTTTKQAGFTDATGDTALPNPIILNERGEVAPSAEGTSCGLWLDPTLAYKFVLSPADDTDPPTAAIWTIDNIVSPASAVLAALAAYEATIGGVPIGSMTAYGGTTAPNGWLLCFGQAVSRTVYALLFAVIGTAYGPGDSSTTFNLPDKRGRVSVGKDDMGGSPASRVTNAVSGIQGATLGASGGDQNAQEDTLAASSTAVSGVTDPGHPHLEQVGQGGAGGMTGWVVNSIASVVDGTDIPTEIAFTGIAVTTSVTTTVTSSLTGGSQNMPPCEIDQIIIFTGVAS